MKLDIEPIYAGGFNCLENSIHSILTWKSIAYEKTFIDSWAFSLNQNSDFELLGEQLNTITVAQTADRYLKHCGVAYKVYKNGYVKDPVAMIKAEIASKAPALLCIDIFDCPWVKEQYHQQHGLHFCVIVGVDEDYIYCIDPNMKLDGRMPKEEFLDRHEAVCTLEIHDQPIHLSDLKSSLNDCIKGLALRSKKNNTFQNLRDFADSLENADLAAEAGNMDSVWHVPLFTGIVRVYGTRCQTKIYLEFLQKYFDDEILSYLIDGFSQILIQWTLIKTLTAKALISKNKATLSKISNRIRNVTELEESLAETINAFVQSPAQVIRNVEEPVLLENSFSLI